MKLSFSYRGFILLSLSQSGVHDEVGLADDAVVTAPMRAAPMRAALLLGAAQLAGSQLATGKSTDCPGCLGCNMIYQQDIRSHAGIRAWSGIRTRLIVFNGL